jgi:hypothetical protein
MSKKHEKTAKFLPMAALLAAGFFAIWWILFGKDSVAPKQAETRKVETNPVQTEDQPSTSPTEDQPTQSDIQASEKTMRNFLQAYLAYNGQQPMAHIEKARQYMTDSFYEKEREGIQRPTYETQTQRLVKIERFEHEVKGHAIQWTVQTILEATNWKGQKRLEEMVFVLKLIKEAGEWKVKEVEPVGSID